MGLPSMSVNATSARLSGDEVKVGGMYVTLNCTVSYTHLTLPTKA